VKMPTKKKNTKGTDKRAAVKLYITAAELRRYGRNRRGTITDIPACAKAQAMFETTFGRRAEITRANVRKWVGVWGGLHWISRRLRIRWTDYPAWNPDRDSYHAAIVDWFIPRARRQLLAARRRKAGK
jgi:hypothetical protein